jgi:hypothetical protein
MTFRRLATEAQSALHAADSGPPERAMELMIGLAWHAQGCFRSEDPLEAARFVVSQAVSALWETVLDARGFAEFTARTVPQLVRWEREYGWSEGLGAGKVREQERPLAEVLARMLETPDMWRGFADAYLAEMDRIAAAEPPSRRRRRARRTGRSAGTGRIHFWTGTIRRKGGPAFSPAGTSRCLSTLTPTGRNGSRAHRVLRTGCGFPQGARGAAALRPGRGAHADHGMPEASAGKHGVRRLRRGGRR